MDTSAQAPTLAVIGPRPDGSYLVDTRLWQDADANTLANMFEYSLAEIVRVDKRGPDLFVITPLGEPLRRSQLVFPFPFPALPRIAKEQPSLPANKLASMLSWLSGCRAAGNSVPPSLPPSWTPSESDALSATFEDARSEGPARPTTPVQQIMTIATVVADYAGYAPTIHRQIHSIDVWRNTACPPPTPQATRIQTWRDGVLPPTPHSERVRSAPVSRTTREEEQVRQYLLPDDDTDNGSLISEHTICPRPASHSALHRPRDPSSGNRPRPNTSRKSKTPSQAVAGTPYMKPSSRKPASRMHQS
jgi:hypothetical protein